MEKQYAQALWKMVAGGMTPKKAVRALYDILVSRGRSDLIPHIAKSFARLAARHQQKEGVVLSIAREKDERKAVAAVQGLLKEISAKRADIDVRVDGTLIGGWRLEGRERLVDASHKRYLLDMYKHATQ